MGESNVLRAKRLQQHLHLGWQEARCSTGVDYYDDDAKRNQNYANTTTRPTTTVGTPNDGAWVADGRAPVQWNTFIAQPGPVLPGPVSLTDTLKLVGGLRYDNFRASYRNAAGNLSNSRSDSLFSPAWA